MIGVYCIENKVNFKRYVGSSINMKERLRNHKNKLKRNKHVNNYLQNAFNKYGIDNFNFLIICEVQNKDDLLKVEQYYIDLYNSFYDSNGYNIRRDASSNLGFKHAEETKAKLSKISKKRFAKKENHNRYGVPVSSETRRKLSESRKGIKSFWYKNGERLQGEKNPNSRLTAENVKNIKLRLQNGEVGAHIAKEYGVSKVTIYNIRDGKRWSHVVV